MSFTRWLACLTVWVGCSNDAPPPRHTAGCGDNVITQDEGCDDGNNISGDGCSESCTVETPSPMCGNGIREASEACDDNNTTDGDGCSSACTIEPIASACTLFPQSGCSEPTPACDLVDGGGTQCRAVTKQGTSNTHCDADTECKVGFTCLTDSALHPAWCSRLCTQDDQCTGSGSRCVVGIDDGSGSPLAVHACSNACDPYEQSGCPSGMGCVIVDATSGDYTDCRYMGTKLAGESCTRSTDCTAGSVCASSVCRPICIVGDSSTCTRTCWLPASPVTIDDVSYGECH